MRENFHAVAKKTSEIMGSPWSFAIAVLLIGGWAVGGMIFGFSDSWQLIINTATTILTFLMVFLIQNTQNRDAKAIHLKLDELIKSSDSHGKEFIDLEDMKDEELDDLQEKFKKFRETPKNKS